MKIIILGAGRVGESVAESLVSEQNDITVVDTDAAKLTHLQERFDLRTLTGNAILPTVLRDAGAEDADMLVAVTALDESNLVACKLAQQLFNIPTRIARVRSAQFQDVPEITGEGGFEAQTIICPEQSVVDVIERLIEYPDALQVLEFGDGRVSLVAVRAEEGGPIVQHRIGDMRQQIPGIDLRIVAVFRNDRPLKVSGEMVIQAGDEVFCLAATQHIRTVVGELRRMDRPVRRVIVAGGGNIGLRLARSLGDDYNVKIIESVRSRCDYLATQLSASTLVLNGDGTDEDLLVDESVYDTDLFLALTDDDEDNIMSCLLAKRLGARRTLAIINRKSYAELMQGGAIDIAISPSHATIGELLRHIRRGDIVAVHSLRRGAAEALELVAHGDAKDSRVVGKRIEDLDLPKGAMVGAIVRGLQGGADGQTVGTPKVVIAHDDTVIESEDRVIVFIDNKRILPKVERLFQVGIGFF